MESLSSRLTPRTSRVLRKRVIAGNLIEGVIQCGLAAMIIQTIGDKICYGNGHIKKGLRNSGRE